MASSSQAGVLIWAVSRHLTSSDDLSHSIATSDPLLHPMQVPNLPKDLQITIKSSSNTPLFARAGVHRHTQTNKTKQAPACTCGYKHKCRNTSRSCPFGWHCVEASGLLCHACVNLSRALWTLFTSQCCWGWPVFVTATYTATPKDSWRPRENTTDSKQHRQ